MDMIERECQFRHDPLELGEQQVRAGLDLLLEIRVPKQLHHEVRQAPFLRKPMDADDRGVIERRGHLEFVREQLPHIRVRRHLRYHRLHHTAVAGLVGGLPDLAVLAHAQLGDECQRAEVFGERLGHGGGDQ